MKKNLILTIITVLIIAGSFIAFSSFSKSVDKETVSKLKDGDMIFQTSESSQCEAVRIATNSKFSHCGIIFIENGNPLVYEAVQPVKVTPLNNWIAHGRNKSYVITRLKNKILPVTTVKKMKEYAINFLNKDYDLYFEWSDDKIYCSEYVWKIYKNAASIELCDLQTLKNFNLKDQKVHTILKQRYGNNIPLNEKVVAPSQLVDSKLVQTIEDTY